MPKVRQTKEWTKSDALAEVIAADPCDFVLETSPPVYVEKISQLLGSSSVGQTGRDGAAANPADTDSDSADSLFITQKPVPEAVRSGRRRPHSARSGPTSPSFQEEHEDDSSPSASPQESRRKKYKKKVKFRLPKYSFPFLKDKTLKLTSTVLPGPQNIRLHYSSMGGFFDCMRKLRQSYQTGEDLETNLPTLDMNGECILPISEEEEEEEPFEDADMKVVAKKRFVVPSRVKRSQPWNSEKKRDGEVEQQRRSCINAVDKMSRGWKKTLHKIQTKNPSLRSAPSPNLESSDDEDSSYRILGAGEASDKQQKGERSVLAQTEMPKTSRSLNREKKDNSEQKEKEDEPCDSSPLCEQSPNESIQGGREASITEPHADALNREGLSQAGQQDSKSKGQRFFQSGSNNIIISTETRGKKKNDNESAEEDGSQSQEVLEVQHAAPSMNEEVTELEETPHLPQPINEPELHGKRVMEESDISDSQQKKKKRQNESSAEDVEQEAACVNEGITEVVETPRLSHIASELKLNGKTGMEESDVSDSQQKKKKKKQNKSQADNVRQEVREHFDSDVRISEDSVHLGSSNRGKKKKRKNESSAEDVRQEVHEHFESDVRIGEDSVDLASFNRGKKKKKKNNKEDAESVEEEMSQSQEEVEVQHAAAYVNERITKVETPRLSQITSELKLNGKTGMEESDISDSKQKKKKKKKKQNESSAEDVRQEVHEHFDSDVRISEDSVHLMSSNKGKKKKKKKKNDKEDAESVEEEMSQSQEEVEVQHAAAYVNERITKVVETPRLSQIASELKLNGKTGMEESDISDSKQKKKKKKKKQNESSAEDVRQEVHEHLDSDVRISEDSVHLMSSNRGKKKKKKNNKEDAESVEEEKSQSQEEVEVQHAAAYVNEGITEEEETPGLSQSASELEFSEKPVMESGIPNLQQKKKKKKKRKNESSVENEKPEKEKKKTESNDDEEDVEQLKCNTAPESLHEDVEILPEKITAAQCDVSASDSVAAGKPGISTGGESTEMTGSLEESNERVRKKKKRKMSAAQESVEKDEELDFEELKGTCEKALSDTGVRKKKKRKRNETGSESAADAGFSDEAVVVKKKSKKKGWKRPQQLEVKKRNQKVCLNMLRHL